MREIIATPQEKDPLLMRAVAKHLEKVLCEANTSVHWVGVVGENSLGKAKKHWPITDPVYAIAVQPGFSEGMLVYVYAQSNRYTPEIVDSLLQIKMLCGQEQLMKELPIILNYFNSFSGDLT